MKALVLFLVFIVALPALAQPTRESAQTLEIVQGIKKMMEIATHHPEPLVREKLGAWVDGGTVQLGANNAMSDMSVSRDVYNGRVLIMIFYNPVNFIRLPGTSLNEADKDRLRQLMLYHQAVKVDEHMSGRLAIPPGMMLNPPPKVLEAFNRWLWEAEWIAVEKDWALVKKWGKTYLMPEMEGATRNGESPRSFLEGFYAIQLKREEYRLSPANFTTITARYKAELAKLPKQ